MRVGITGLPRGRDLGKTRVRRGLRPEVLTMEDRQLLSVYTVTNTSGDASVSGSLPWAVDQANTQSQGLDYINFDIEGSGPHEIDITQTLYLNDQVVIDGTTQPGYNGSPVVTVLGNANVPSLFLLQKASSGSVIQGLQMANYTANAVTIFPGSDRNIIRYNWMGFYQDAAGQVHLNSSQFDNTSSVGVQSNSNNISYNTIDGTYNGIVVGEDPAGKWSGTVYTGNIFQYNKIGTDPTGATSTNYGNTHSGIFFGEGVQSNYIGPGNVLSGNAVQGVEFLDSTVESNVVFGNMIGTDATGMKAIPNGVGVLIAGGSQGNVVGGPWGGNVISGNRLAGIALGNPDYPIAADTWVQWNIIGLNADQSAAIPGQDVGISLQAKVTRTNISNNAIAGNTTNGVVVANSTSNYIANNFIGESGYNVSFANGAYGVALLPQANNNWVLGNVFGPNVLGNGYVDPAARNNDAPDLTRRRR